MRYIGHIENGVVVFAEPVPLATGMEVRVEPVAFPAAEFWEPSLEELARRHGVSALRDSAEEMFGDWPENELDEEFENVVASWRELEQVQ